MIRNLPNAAGYTDSKGIFAARKAIMHYTQQKGIKGVTLEDIYVGNGVSELIVMAMNALLNTGDEVLVPAPDYPLWTAAVSLSGGTPALPVRRSQRLVARSRRHPRKITPAPRRSCSSTRTTRPARCIRTTCWRNRRHRPRAHLIIYADEVYDKVLYDGVKHTSIASLAEDVLTITFNGLSKNYRSCGYRAGWMVVSGDKRHAKDYIEGLNMLASMRLCANAPGQFGIQTALGGYQSIDDLVKEGGRLRRQRDLAHELITAIRASAASSPRRRCTCSRGSTRRCIRSRTTSSSSELLQEEKVLLVQGTGFNWPHPDHFRLVFLPHEDDLREAIAASPASWKTTASVTAQLVAGPQHLATFTNQQLTTTYSNETYQCWPHRHRHRRRWHLHRSQAQRGRNHPPRRPADPHYGGGRQERGTGQEQVTGGAARVTDDAFSVVTDPKSTSSSS
jgi:alanine-synthesizing transaminase